MMYILISTNKGQVIQLSYHDSDLSTLTWTVNSSGYAVGRYNGPVVHLHKLIGERMSGAPIPTGMVVDHINGNKLDCRRENLRIATYRQNTQNKKPHKNSRTGYKGIQTNGSSWYARIRHNGAHEFYGPYATPLEAAKMYDIKAKEYFGEYARINGV